MPRVSRVVMTFVAWYRFVFKAFMKYQRLFVGVYLEIKVSFLFLVKKWSMGSLLLLFPFITGQAFSSLFKRAKIRYNKGGTKNI